MSDDKHSPFSTLNPPLIPPGYKQTEVGVIPEDWDVVPIGKAGQVLGGRQRSPHYEGELCKYLRVANVFDGFIESEDVLEMPFSSAEKERFLLKDGDILLNEGQSIELVGRSAIYRGTPEDRCFQNMLVRFRAGPSVCPEFAQLVFQQYLRTGVFASIALQTTSIAHLGAGRFAALKMPRPTKVEQEAITEALNDTDAFIESLEQLIAKKRQIKQGAMQELLTGKKRLPGFATKPGYKQTEVGVIPDDWKVTTVGEISDVKTGPFGSSLHERDYVNNGTPIITVEHLGESGVHHTNLPMVSDADKLRLKAYSLRQGDIVFSRVGSVDRNALIKVAEDGWLFSGRLLRVRLKGSDTDAPYLSYHFYSEAFKQRVRDVAVGQTMASINTQILMGVKIILPPTRAEQTAIATILSDIDDEIVALEEKLVKARRLKQGMMQELLTGKTRLVESAK
jgi:type I restriction enzyme, S subunit